MTAASDPKTHEPYTIEKHGFRTIFYSMVGQYGTHVDPPAHFDPNGVTMDKIDVKQMVLPLVVFDDIAWSDGMRRAWNRIARSEGVEVAVDLGPLGLCVINRRAAGQKYFRIPMN